MRIGYSSTTSVSYNNVNFSYSWKEERSFSRSQNVLYSRTCCMLISAIFFLHGRFDYMYVSENRIFFNGTYKKKWNPSYRKQTIGYFSLDFSMKNYVVCVVQRQQKSKSILNQHMENLHIWKIEFQSPKPHISTTYVFFPGYFKSNKNGRESCK